MEAFHWVVIAFMVVATLNQLHLRRQVRRLDLALYLLASSVKHPEGQD